MDGNLTDFLSDLREPTLEAGANDATIIDAKMISLEEEIITICSNKNSET